MARAPAVQDVEAAPEADRLEGFPHPRETRILFGHQSAEQMLAEAFASGRMHHAWLLTGRAGIGKATLAYRLARHVLARTDERDRSGKSLDVPTDSAAARQVAALSHPGLLVLRRPYDAKSKRLASTIPVDEVRRLKSFLGLTSGENAWRIVIVDTADELNLNAANALLKALEEPPRHALFILVASEPSGLLPTIRSRCRRLMLRPLGADDVARAAADALGRDAAEPDIKAAAIASDGSVARALDLLGGTALAVRERVNSLLAALPAVDPRALHALGDALGRSDESAFTAFVDTVRDWLSARVTVAGAEPARLVRIADVWDRLNVAADDTKVFNLERKPFVFNVFGWLAAATRG